LVNYTKEICNVFKLEILKYMHICLNECALCTLPNWGWQHQWLGGLHYGRWTLIISTIKEVTMTIDENCPMIFHLGQSQIHECYAITITRESHAAAIKHYFTIQTARNTAHIIGSLSQPIIIMSSCYPT